MRALSVMEDLMISFDDRMKLYEKVRFIQLVFNLKKM
jgi:hypothetical protein